MTFYNLLLLIHILLLVYWLGSDLGVFYSSYFVLNRDLSVETRVQMTKFLFNMDMGPRITMILMFPVGLSMAAELGLVAIGGAGLAAVWIAAMVWLWWVMTIHFRDDSLADLLTRIDWVFRISLVTVLMGLGIWSLAGDGPFEANWLSIKVMLFALTIAFGLGIRVVLRPFGPAFQQIVAGEGDSAAEAQLAGAMHATYPWVIALWVALIAAAAMGVMKL